MNQRKLKWVTLVVALTAVLMLSACKKKVVPAPPPPPPAAPTASLNASPETVQKGQSTTLTWQTANATDVSIDGIGAVQASGSRQATPADSTTYTLMAKGPGGTQTASARVTVAMPPPPPPPPPQPGPTEKELFSQNVKDVYFDYDKAAIRADQQNSLQVDARFLAQHPSIKFTISGHCDERGSIEYNLALGENRASSAKQA
jgi:peptidoglycan-associated lipoprotein